MSPDFRWLCTTAIELQQEGGWVRVTAPNAQVAAHRAQRELPRGVVVVSVNREEYRNDELARPEGT